MAVPNVFVSSTWYDLRYIRENLRYFIRTLGFNPVLTEEGSVYYDPRVAVEQACLTEIPNTQLFVLIIGGRFGSVMPDSSLSVTNAEYGEAVRLKIPVFALVEQGVFGDYDVFRKNVEAGKNISDLVFPNADSPAIFKFIEEVRSAALNNALVPFRDFADIEAYLRAQWAGMLHSYLTSANEEARVTETLGVLTDISQRIEILTQQVLRSVGTPVAKTNAAMYERMLRSEAIRDLAWLGLGVTPLAVLKSETLLDCAKDAGKEIVVDMNSMESSVSGGDEPKMSKFRWEADEADFRETRSDLQQMLRAAGLTERELEREAEENRLVESQGTGPTRKAGAARPRRGMESTNT